MLQSKLLTVLEDRSVRRLGGKHTREVRVRIIAATNKNVERSVKDGSFREDLYFRLNILRLQVPPLRERRGEIGGLAEAFLEELRGTRDVVLGADEQVRLAGYAWPGNVRELRNIIERALWLEDGRELHPSRLLVVDPSAAAMPVARSAQELLEPLDAVIARHVLQVYDALGQSQQATAQTLGISLSTLRRRLQDLGRLAAVSTPRASTEAKGMVGAAKSIR
jgi:transcriptional regulator with PAS, ATPase and Fis domain